MAEPIYNIGATAPAQQGAFRDEVERLQQQLDERMTRRRALLAQSGFLPITLDGQQRKTYESLDAEIAALQAQLDALLTAAYTPSKASADWVSALDAYRAQAVAKGEEGAETSNRYTLSPETMARLRGETQTALPSSAMEAMNAGLTNAATTRQAAEAQSAGSPLPAWAQSQQPQQEQPVTGDITGGTGGGTMGGIDLSDPYTLLGLGVPPEVIVAAQLGDTNALANWSATKNQAATAETGYNEQALANAEQIRRQMQQQQIEQDALSGVLGGLAPSGAISPQNIQDYVGEQGVYGDITRAYYNQLTGNPTPWQLQQWQASQGQIAADNAYRQQALSQQAAYQQAMLEQQRREMAAQIGSQVANMANQSYMNTLGFRLPAGTEYAPGFQPGGVMSQLAGMSGMNYNPSRIGVANPPTTDELMRTVQDAISRF